MTQNGVRRLARVIIDTMAVGGILVVLSLLEYEILAWRTIIASLVLFWTVKFIAHDVARRPSH